MPSMLHHQSRRIGPVRRLIDDRLHRLLGWVGGQRRSSDMTRAIRFEPLESRLMLSADLVGLGDASLATTDNLDSDYAYLVETSPDGTILAHPHHIESDDTTETSSDGLLDADQQPGTGQDVLNILIDFPDMVGDPLPAADAETAFDAAGEFMFDASWGDLWFENVDITTTYRMPHSTDYYASNGVDGAIELMDHALAAVSADGFEVNDYWSHALSFDWIAGFGWAGLGWVGAPGIWLNGYGNSAGTIAHEFGHNLGAWHSGWWQVSDGDPLSPDGAFVEYGDVFDVMGWPFDKFPDNHFNTYWKSDLGWMDATTNVLDPVDDGVYRLYAHDFGAGSYVSDRTYALRLPGMNGADYWLEYRQAPYGEISEAGVEVRLSPSSLSEQNTLLIDTSGTGIRADRSPLQIGEAFVDSARDLVVTPLQSGVGDDGNWWIDVQLGENSPATAVSDPGDVTTTLADHTFTVTYAHDLGIDAATVVDNDDAVRITGPNGFEQFASFVEIDDSTDGTPRTATYRIDAPDGQWDDADNGDYTVWVEADQVASTGGDFVAAGQLGEFLVEVDTTPPESVVHLEGDAGSGDWFTGPVELTLSATDNVSGVDRIEYRLDDAETWQTYVGPFTVDEDGVTMVEYRAIDEAAHVEATQTADIHVDTTAPIAEHALSGEAGNGSWFIGAVEVTLSAADNISGVGGIEFRLGDGDSWQAYTTPITVEDNGVTTLSYRAVDQAGNVGTVQTVDLQIDTALPTISVGAADLAGAAPDLSFSVTYRDNIAVDVSRLLENDQAIRVTGPDGVDRAASFVSIDDESDSAQRTVIYSIEAPAGGWAVSHGGVYDIYLQAGQLGDTSGNDAAAGLAGTFSVSFGLELVIGQDYGGMLSYTDADGTDVSVRLTGGRGEVTLLGLGLEAEESRGGLRITGGSATLDRIALADTTSRDMLSIRGRGGDGIATINAITGDGSLGRLHGRELALAGEGIVFSEAGVIENLYLGDLYDHAMIVLPGEADRGISMRLGKLGENVDLLTGSSIRNLSATAWASGSLTASAVGMLNITGDRRTDTAGGFGANVTLTDADGDTVLGNARIDGAVTNAAWNLAGAAGMIAVGDAAGWTLDADGHEVRMIRAGLVSDSSIVAGAIGGVQATSWVGGQIEAGSIGMLQTRGDRRAGIEGDFSVDLTLTDAAAGDVLRSARIAGEINDSSWLLSGGAGMIAAGDTSAFVVEAGDVRGLRLGIVSNSRVDAGAIGQVQASAWAGGSIDADSIRSLQMRGDRFADVDGDFAADLTLSDDQARQTLGNVRITGMISAGTWTVAGSAGLVAAEGADNWTLHADELRGFRLGLVADTTVVAAEVSMIQTTAWSGGAITAESVATLQTRGDFRTGIAGNFSADLTLTDADARMTLRNARIAGALVDSTWRIAGSVGHLMAGAIRSSDVFVGTDSVPDEAADLAPGAMLRAISLRGIRDDAGPTFVDSHVAAWQISRASIGSVATANEGDSFGMTTTELSRLQYGTPYDSGTQNLTADDFAAIEPYEDDDFMIRIL